jgi:hypothetical protein
MDAEIEVNLSVITHRFRRLMSALVIDRHDPQTAESGRRNAVYYYDADPYRV